MSAEQEILVDGTKDYLNYELWKLCVGPLFDFPKVGDKVYYFLQGHIEQLEKATKENFSQIEPLFDLPSKLCCTVIGTQLKVDNNTDEVYAQMALLVDASQVEIPILTNDEERPKFNFFTKILTTSDTSTHGGLSIPKRHAIECLPPLDMSQSNPTQEIVAKDLHGYEWKFKHIFRGTPLRHIFTTGWSAFTTTKKLVTGDCLVFLRGENGESRIGIRRVIYNKDNVSSSVISTQNMFYGIMASAYNATTTNCVLNVVYNPSSSQFVIGFDKFVDALNNKFNVGSRFSMRFENNDFTQIRHSGTIVGINDMSSHWKKSEWRSIKVQWDNDSSIPRPDKVSPWEIEHIAPSQNVLQPNFIKNKRSRHVNDIGSNLHVSMLTESQEIGQSSMNSSISFPQISYQSATNKETTNYKLFGVDLRIPKETKDPMEQAQSLTTSKGIQRNQISYTTSRIKVLMQDMTLERRMDLNVINGYIHLLSELDNLFDLKGELQTREKWELIFTNYEGDMMLVGDDSWTWTDFCKIVKKIFICSKEEVKKMKSRNIISKGDSSLTTTVVTCSKTPPNIKITEKSERSEQQDNA